MARWASCQKWIIEAVLNNDMIVGNVEGINGAIDNAACVCSHSRGPVTDSAEEWQAIRRFGGEVDGPSRQLARYVDRITDTYLSVSRINTERGCDPSA